MQTIQQLVISRAESSAMAWCQGCADHVSMVTTEEAAVLTDSNSRAIYRSVEGGELHFVETSEGFLLICLKSLSEMAAKNNQEISVKEQSTRKPRGFLKSFFGTRRTS